MSAWWTHRRPQREKAYSHLQRGINDNRNTMCSVTGRGWVARHTALHMKKVAQKVWSVTDVNFTKRSVIKVCWNKRYCRCIHVNVLCIFIRPLNHEGLTDKLPRLLFGPLRGGAGSGLEQWGLCVCCPQDSKWYSSVPGSRSRGFGVCIKHTF